MPYGEIFTGTFRQLWRHKKLFSFGLLAALLGAIGSAISQVFSLQWQSSWYRMMNRWMLSPDMLPGRLGYDVATGMSWFGVGCCVVGLLAIVGYIVSLVMRGAIMHEAGFAWQGSATDFSRGVSAGAGRSVYIFLIDLLWFVLPLLLMCGGSALFVILITLAASAGNGSDAGGAVIGWIMLTLICGLVCVGMIIGIVTSLFSPLMYQSAVVGRRSAGEAVREGWQLTRDHLGPMIIFWLLLIGLGLLLSVVMWLITAPLALPWLATWMSDMTRYAEDFQQGRGGVMPAFNSGWLILSTAATLLVSFLVQGFLTSFRYTLYAEVYRRLTGIPPATVAVVPPPPPDATPAEPVAPLIIEPLPATESDVIVPDAPLFPPEPEEPPRA
jgi:hypothetical protein